MSVTINFVEDIFSGMTDKGCSGSLKAGDAQWSKGFGLEGEPGSLIFICPCGCSKIRSVPVTGNRAWKWNGDKTLPTLKPSILIVGECGWHGWLTNGVFTSC